MINDYSRKACDSRIRDYKNTDLVRLNEPITTEYKKYQELFAGKNINPQTLLATDYLNHFNEIHMLLGMIVGMPDCNEDILEWQAITYQDHFKHSVFQDKDLAIKDYNYAPQKY